MVSIHQKAFLTICFTFFNNTTSMSNSREKSLLKEQRTINLSTSIKEIERCQASIDNEALNLKWESKGRKPIQTRQLIKDIQKIEADKKRVEDKSKCNTVQTHKNTKLDLMRLKDKQFIIDKNIYNIAIGEVASRQAYISSLHEQIAKLKGKIRILQDEELSRLAAKSIEDPLRISVESGLHQQQKKPICGRIYSKDSSPIFNKRSTPNHHKDPPQIASHPSPKSCNTLENGHRRGQAQIQKKSEQEIEIDVHANYVNFDLKETKFNKLRHQKISTEEPTQLRVQTESQKVRILSQYRIKQKSNKHIIDMGLQDEATQIGLLQQRTDHKLEINRKGTSEKESSQDGQTYEEANEVKCDEVTNPIFLDDPSWEITSIYDDFRSKIQQKLQIPSQFPPPKPDPTDTLESFQRQAAQIYQIFNIDVRKFKQKVKARKFKNGIYYQLKPNKNMVRYFDGSFYLGEWDTEISSESEKTGLGFEYVPNKYYYLGRFSNGNRSGRGVIKIISSRGHGFMGYDGEWMNGKPHGFGKHIDDQGNKYIGSFEQGERTGKAVMMTKNGQSYEGEVIKGLKHGQGIEKQPNGDVFIGCFFEGKFHGAGTYKWKNGSVFQGQFVMGKREGKGVWRSFNGETFEGEYQNDLKHGWGKFTWNNGQIYEGQFQNDIRNGEGSYKHPKGKIGKYIWKDGHIDRRLDEKAVSSVEEE